MGSTVILQDLPIQVERVQDWRGATLGLTEELHRVPHSKASGSGSQGEQRLRHRRWGSTWGGTFSYTTQAPGTSSPGDPSPWVQGSHFLKAGSLGVSPVPPHLPCTLTSSWGLCFWTLLPSWVAWHQ